MKLKYTFSSEEEQRLTFQLFICMPISSFTSSVNDINIVEGKTLTANILFGVTLFVVVFLTFGLSYEVCNLIFRPMKNLLRKLRNMQY